MCNYTFFHIWDKTLDIGLLSFFSIEGYRVEDCRQGHTLGKFHMVHMVHRNVWPTLGN